MTLASDPCAVMELRQYTLHPGRRDALIELFDREFVETQEVCGMRVIGQFRDLDDPDRFVWLRGFASMDARRRGLGAFYGGPVWAAHRAAANATMVDSDNVLLLRPAWPGAADALRAGRRAAPGSTLPPAGLVDITIFHLREPAGPDLLDGCRERMSTVWREGGALKQAWLVTEPAANDFPRLPVREGEAVLVGVAVFAGTAAFETFGRGGPWSADVLSGLSRWLSRPSESFRLAPTARSALHA
jgi:hypothetical protein